MVRAILDGRKTVTRRVKKIEKAPCNTGDILYVRETFAPLYPNETSKEICGYLYKADEGDDKFDKNWREAWVDYYDKRFLDGENYMWEGRWQSSIHMPKEAARIFLRVKDVSVERLWDITNNEAKKEGVTCETDNSGQAHRWYFYKLWDSTVKKSDRDKYGWDANPFVWVIEFERVDFDGNA